jgi:hypothetical protein
MADDTSARNVSRNISHVCLRILYSEFLCGLEKQNYGFLAVVLSASVALEENRGYWFRDSNHAHTLFRGENPQLIHHKVDIALLNEGRQRKANARPT